MNKITNDELLAMASEYIVGYDPLVNGRLFNPETAQGFDKNRCQVRVKNMGNPDPNQHARWGIFGFGGLDSYCLNKQGEWEYQSLPSSRDEDFYERCRYKNAKEAIRYYRRWYKHIIKQIQKKIKENPDKVLFNLEDFEPLSF